MKKLFVLVALSSGLHSNIHAQTLFTYGAKKVSTAEFLDAFNKNNSGTMANSMNAKEYLELYTNFKLKVQAAKDLRLDTLPNLIQDADAFRGQIMDGYLTNDAGVKRLLKEAFQRSQEDVHVIHHSFADTTNAATKAADLYKALQKDGSKIDKSLFPGLATSDFGFLTVFSVAYDYENQIYNTPVGGYSNPILKNKKWHIFQLVSKRPAVGQWTAAQILIAFPQGINTEEKMAVKNKADSIYNLVVNGMPFEEAAKQFSNDRYSNSAGGLLPTFGTGKYDNDFESQIFALKKDGDISRPFASELGYHIVKRISVVAVVKDENDFNNQYELRQKMSNDARMQMEKESYATEIVKKTGWTVSSNAVMQRMITSGANIKPADEKLVIGKYKVGKVVTGSDWKNHLNNYWKTHENDGSVSNANLWAGFEKEMAAKNFTTNIENYNTGFSNQMKEFREGNLLFDVMEKKVWSKASNDEAALKKHYDALKSNYIWGPSADALVINCNTRELAEQTIVALKNGVQLQTLVEKSVGNIFTDSSRFELDQLIGKNSAMPQAGSFSAAVTNSENGGNFIYFIKIYPAGEQKTYGEARGQVVSEYQTVLETEWLAKLRKAYPVKYNAAEVNKLK